MKLKFLGAAGMVTGSSYFLSEDDDGGVLIDMGMFQGSDDLEQLNYQPFQVPINKLKGVVLTHAHLDHCGRLPILARLNYEQPIFMTAATAKLLAIALYDAAKVAYENRGDQALYSEEEVRKILSLVRVVNYDEPFKIDEFEIVFKDAGHILGSASLSVKGKNRTIIFSGDLGNSPQPLIKPTEFFETGDDVVMESTYGDRIHEDKDPLTVLASEIGEIESNGGTLLIPAFSLERTQELLHMIDHLKKASKVKQETLVFLDSPMAIKATEVFKEYENLYNEELTEHVKRDDPFDFPGLVVVENHEGSKEIVKMDRAKVIIAGSGMMTGGRILNHALTFLGDEKNRILFVGFQAEGSIGRRILEGEPHVMIYGRLLMVRANIAEITSMSAHADQPKLIEWLRHIKFSGKLFLTHGEDLPRVALAAKVRQELGLEKIEMPRLGEEVVLES